MLITLPVCWHLKWLTWTSRWQYNTSSASFRYWAGLSQLECMFAVENTEVLFKRILLQHEQRGSDMTELLLSDTSEIFPCSVMTGFPPALLCWKADMHLKWGKMEVCSLMLLLFPVTTAERNMIIANFCCKLFMFYMRWITCKVGSL